MMEPPLPPPVGPAAGWYPDPSGSGSRWWDGSAWGIVAPGTAPATPSPHTRRRGLFWSLAVLGLAGALVGSIVALSGQSNPPWPASIAPIAAFVSKDRQLSFVHTVPVHFVPAKAFDAQIAKQDQPANRSQRADSARYAAEFRALGLIGGAVDLNAAQTAVDAGGVLAYYDQDKKDVVVRGTTLDEATKVTVAHELTHTLQDQHFNLTKLDNQADTADRSFALTSLVEGDAVVTEGDYTGSLSAANQRKANAQNNPAGGSSPARSSGSGPTSDASFLDINSAEPYVLGPDFTLVLYLKGQTRLVNHAFVRPPTTELDILNPAAYLLGTPSHRVRTPVLPPGTKRDGSPDSFGAFDVYMTLAGYMDARTALVAADGWGGGSVVQYRQRGRTCTRFDVVGQSASAGDVLHAALVSWAQSLPLHQATVTLQGQTIEVTACDPGKLTTVGTRSRGHALDIADERNSNIGTAFIYGVTSPKVALCVGDQALADPTLLDAESKANAGVSAPSSALQSVLDQHTLHLIAVCRGPHPPASP